MPVETDQNNSPQYVDDVLDFLGHQTKFVVEDHFKVNHPQEVPTKNVTPAELLDVVWVAGRQGDLIVPCDNPRARTIGFSTSSGVYSVPLTQVREKYYSLPEGLRDLICSDRQTIANMAMSQEGGLLAKPAASTLSDIVTPDDLRIASETDVDPLNPSCLDYVLAMSDKTVITESNVDPALFSLELVQTRVVFEQSTSMLPANEPWLGMFKSGVRVVNLAGMSPYRLSVAPCKILGVGEGLLVDVFDRYALFLRTEGGTDTVQPCLQHEGRNYSFSGLSANHDLRACIDGWRKTAVRKLEAIRIAKYGDTYDFAAYEETTFQRRKNILRKLSEAGKFESM